MTQKNSSLEPMMNLGEQLRIKRESLGYDLQAASAQTRLRPDIIEKLEANAFSDLGAKVYVRGYLLRYAQFLGIDERVVQEGYPSDSEESSRSLRLNRTDVLSQPHPYRRSDLNSWIALFLVLVVGVGLLIELLDDSSWLMRQIHGAFSSQNQSQVAAAKTPNIVLQVAPKAQSKKTKVNLSPVDAGNVSDDEPLTLSSSEDLGSSTSNTAPAVAPPLPTPAPAAPATPKTPEDNNIVLEIAGNNWIEIKNNQGKVVASKTYHAGNKIVLPVTDGPYKFNIGRPSMVKLSIAGKDQDLSTYRRKGIHTFVVGAK